MANPQNLVQAAVHAWKNIREEDLDDLEALKRDLLARVRPTFRFMRL